LNFLIDFKKANWSGRLPLLTQQYNEHRILSAKTIYVLLYSLTGHIDFRTLIFIGNLQLAFVLLILISFTRKMLPGNWLAPAFMFSVVIFDLNNWQNTTWAMAAMSNFGIIFLFLLSLHLYDASNKKLIYLAVLVQILCTYSNGNGIIGSFCIACYSVLSGNRKKMLFAIPAFLIFAPLYFLHYHKVASTTFHPVPIQMARGLFTFANSFICFHIRPHWIYFARVTSVIFIICLIFVLPDFKQVRKAEFRSGHAVLIALFLFCLFTIITACIFRPISDQIPSRYMAYPNLLICSMILFFCTKFREFKFSNTILATTTFILVAIYINNFNFGVSNMAATHKDILENEYNIGDGIWDPTEAELGKSISDEAAALGIFNQQEQRKLISSAKE